MSIEGLKSSKSIAILIPLFGLSFIYFFAGALQMVKYVILIYVGILTLISISNVNSLKVAIFSTFLCLIILKLHSVMFFQETLNLEGCFFWTLNVLLFFGMKSLLREEIDLERFMIIDILLLYIVVYFILNVKLDVREFDESINLNSVGLSYSTGALFLIRSELGKLTVTKILLLIGLLYVQIILMSRGPILFTLLSVALVNYRTVLKLMSVRNIILIGLIISLVVMSVDLDPILSNFELLISRFNSVDNFLNSSDKSILGRLEYFQDFSRNWYKWVLFGKQGYVPYPHNIFLELYMRFGIIGLSIYLYLLLLFIRALYMINRHSLGVLPRILLVLFIYGFLQAHTSLSLEMNRAMWLGLAGFSCRL